MTVAEAKRYEPRAILACESCGSNFQLSARAFRSYKNGNRLRRCDICRREIRIEVTAEMRHYWRSRFTTEEIIEMAEGIWGPMDTWKPGWKESLAELIE